MKNKYLILLYVSKLDELFEIYIPSNEKVKVVLELIVKIVYDLSDSSFDLNEPHFLLDAETQIIYSETQIIRDTNINNAKKIVLI